MRESFYRRHLKSSLCPRVLAAALALSAVTVSTAARADAPIAVTGVTATAQDEHTVVHVATNGAPKFSARSTDGGRRLLVDLPDAEVNGAPPVLTDKVGLVGGVLKQVMKDGAAATTRASRARAP